MIWRAFFFGFRYNIVSQVVAVVVVFALRPLLPLQGVRRWLALVPLVSLACVLGWTVQAQWRAFAWPVLPPPDAFDAHAMEHQLVVTTALLAGLHELLRLSRRAAGELHGAQLRQIATEGEPGGGAPSSAPSADRAALPLQLPGQPSPPDAGRRTRRPGDVDGPAALPRSGIASDARRSLDAGPATASWCVPSSAVHQVRMGQRLVAKVDIRKRLLACRCRR